jgi:hypothetical protein
VPVVVEAFLIVFLFLAHLYALCVVGELRFVALGLHAEGHGQEDPFPTGFFRAGGLGDDRGCGLGGRWRGRRVY